MRRALPLFLILACLSSATAAGEQAPAKKPSRYRVLLAPLFLAGGIRDAFDAPVKGASSIPIFNRIFIAPLYLLNFATSYGCWSYTDEGIAGGFNAWFNRAGIKRKRRKRTPRGMKDRPWQKDYLPNLRTFWHIVAGTPKEEPAKAQ